jgi:hypothetical protein
VRSVLGAFAAHGVKSAEPKNFNAKSEAANLAYYKIGPLISLGYALAYNKDIVGQPTTPLKATARTLSPMAGWDIYESTKPFQMDKLIRMSPAERVETKRYLPPKQQVQWDKTYKPDGTKRRTSSAGRIPR